MRDPAALSEEEKDLMLERKYIQESDLLYQEQCGLKTEGVIGKAVESPETLIYDEADFVLHGRDKPSHFARDRQKVDRKEAAQMTGNTATSLASLASQPAEIHEL